MPLYYKRGHSSFFSVRISMITFAGCIAPSLGMAIADSQPSNLMLLATSQHTVLLVFSMISYLVSSLAKRIICFIFYIAWLSPLQLLLLRRLGLSDQLGEFQERKPQVRSHLWPALQPVPPCRFVQGLLACFYHYILFHSFSPFSWLILSSIGYLLYGP